MKDLLDRVVLTVVELVTRRAVDSDDLDSDDPHWDLRLRGHAQ